MIGSHLQNLSYSHWKLTEFRYPQLTTGINNNYFSLYIFVESLENNMGIQKYLKL